jgi:hypothetical protein
MFRTYNCIKPRIVLSKWRTLCCARKRGQQVVHVVTNLMFFVVIRFAFNQECVSKEVTGGWTKLNNEVIHRRDGRSCRAHVRGNNVNKIFNRISEGKMRPLGRSRRKWQLKVDDRWGCELQPSDSKWGSVDTCCEHGNEQSFSTKYKELVDELSDRWAVTKDLLDWAR